MIRAMQARAILLAAIVVIGASTIALSQAPPQSASPAAPDPANFTGRVTANPTSNIRPTRDTFEAGARPGAPLTQVAISFGTTTWLEKVSDEQYRAAAVK
jgi:hypothetical protein